MSPWCCFASPFLLSFLRVWSSAVNVLVEDKELSNQDQISVGESFKPNLMQILMTSKSSLGSMYRKSRFYIDSRMIRTSMATMLAVLTHLRGSFRCKIHTRGFRLYQMYRFYFDISGSLFSWKFLLSACMNRLKLTILSNGRMFVKVCWYFYTIYCSILVGKAC